MHSDGKKSDYNPRKYLLDEGEPGKDCGESSWYSDKHASICIDDTELKGTIRSTNCKSFVIKGKGRRNMCSECQNVEFLQSFRLRLVKRAEKGNDRITTNINNNKLTNTERLKKLKSQAEHIQTLQSNNFFLMSKNLRCKIRIRNLKESLKEYAARGSIKAFAYKLELASQSGLLKQKQFMLDAIGTFAQNLHVKKKGKRYPTSQKLLYEALSYMGGPKMVCFYALNFEGPDIHTVFRWRQQNRRIVLGQPTHESFIILREIYGKLTEKYGKCPVQRSEDETAIIKKITYHQESDTMMGTCGIDGPNHQCQDEDIHVIGEGEEGYNRIREVFDTCRPANYGRAVLLNPLNPNLPKLPVLVVPTCNKFSHLYVYQQWQKIDRLYKDHLEEVLGPLLGPASDGDSRRRKLMIQLMTTSVGSRFYPVPRDEGFIFTARLIPGEDGKYDIEDLCDQDYVHNVKKFTNLLLHTSRQLMVGQYMAHMNDLLYVQQNIPYDIHGLGQQEVNRNDRQNYVSCEKLAFQRVINCLQQHPAFRGTLIYIKILSHYLNIFHSPVASLQQRIHHASVVYHFLGIWHNFIVRSPGLHISTHFITTQTYKDVLLSCSSVVSLIVYMRDNFPDLQCRLDLTGTDCVEVFWSLIGQWVGNHRQYTFGDLRRNLGAMMRLEEIRVDPEGPEFAKPHPKQESIWGKQDVYNGREKADLTLYPGDDEVLAAWRHGKNDAQALASESGMKPDDDDDHRDAESDNDDDNDDNLWFKKPFKYPQNHFSSDLGDLSSDDEDECNYQDAAEPQLGNGAEEELEMQFDDEGEGHLLAHGASDVRTVLDQDLSCMEEESNGRKGIKASPFVTIPGKNKQIYKSTLIASLNEDSKLSADRLTRVRQRNEYGHQRDIGNKAEMSGVCLYDDYAYWDNENACYKLGRVQRMIHAGVHGKQDYRLPVPFDSDKRGQISVFMMVFELCESCYSLNGKVEVIAFSNIMSPVNLIFNMGMYQLPHEETTALDEESEKRRALKTRKKKTPSKRQHQNRNKYMEEDGMNVITVVPESSDNPSDNRRVSQRTRKVRISATCGK